MIEIETLRTRAEIVKMLAELPDDMSIDQEHAALYIDVTAPPSPKTMETWRRTNDGPPFRVGRGRTSNISYPLDELRAWLQSRKVKNTMQGHELRYGSLQSLSAAQAWVVRDNVIQGHILTAPSIELVGQGGLLVTDTIDAVFEHAWAPGSRKPFAEAIRALTESAYDLSRAVILQDRLADGSVEAPTRRAKRTAL